MTFAALLLDVVPSNLPGIIIFFILAVMFFAASVWLTDWLQEARTLGGLLLLFGAVGIGFWATYFFAAKAFYAAL